VQDSALLDAGRAGDVVCSELLEARASNLPGVPPFASNTLPLPDISGRPDFQDMVVMIVPVPEPGVVLAGLFLLGWMIFSFRPQLARAVGITRR
jgi:hypothetical protein